MKYVQGFHIGQHRLKPGKRCAFEEDINIPLLISGPDVAQGATSGAISSHTDLAPTILQMLGLPLQNEFDGAPIDYTSGGGQSEFVNVEFWDSSITPQGMSGVQYYNNTYKALRWISEDNSFLYNVWCTGEHEFYDMSVDPGQLVNRLADPPQGSASQYYGRPEKQLFHRLDAVLLVAKSCTQDACRNPWGVLFPGGQVTSLKDAMREQYDSFFADQPKVSFNSCPAGHDLSQEGPQDASPFKRSKSRRRQHLMDAELLEWYQDERLD